MAESLSKTEKSLYARFLKREESAVTEVVLRYRAGLILFINGYVKNHVIAEDIASEVFVKILVKKPKIKNENYFKTYLYSVGKNSALTYLRKNKLVSFLNCENLPYNDDPETLAIQNETRRKIINAITTLKTEYRQVLMLRYYENLTVEDISKITKLNKKQVYNSLQRGKDALKNILEKEGVYFEAD